MAKLSRNRFRAAVLLALTLALLAGCSRGPKLLPVAGKITLDGQPVAGAAVLFMPSGGSPATGTTDASGRYELSTNNRPGALAGSYKVSVTLQEVGNWQGDPTGTSGSPPPGTPMGKWIVPQVYANPQTSGLAAEVAAGKTSFDFTLSSK